MNLFKRGFASVTRKAGKSAILLVLIFVLCNVMAGAISVQSAIGKTREVMQDKIGMEVSAGLDVQSIMQGNRNNMGDLSNIASLTPEIIKEIGSSEYVKSYDYFTTLSLTSDTLERVESESSNSTGGFPSGGPGGGGGGTRGFAIGGGAILMGGGGFTLSGGENPKVTALESGDATLYNGNTFTQAQMDSGENVVMISKELAEKNNLSVGDTFTLTRALYKMTTVSGSANGGGSAFRIDRNADPEKTLSFDFTVAGIFEPNAELATSEDGTLQQVESSLVNTLYTSNAAINKLNTQVAAEEKAINGETVTAMFNQYTPSFVLKNPEDLELFTSTQKSKLPANYVFSDNSETYNEATAPMANLEWIANIILYVAIGASVLILSLLITLFLRDRRHEMGIYLSLGEKKGKIAAQILVEVLCIAIIAVSLSVFSGNLLAKGISGGMLENQILQEQQKASEQAQGNNRNPGGGMAIVGGGNNRSSQSDALAAAEDLKSSYTVTLNLNVILLIYLAGIGTVIVSTLVPIVYTLRLKPKKILM